MLCKEVVIGIFSRDDTNIAKHYVKPPTPKKNESARVLVRTPFSSKCFT